MSPYSYAANNPIYYADHMGRGPKPGFWSTVLDGTQLVIDVLGFIPAVGEIADGVNALISLARGDYAGAALSATAMIPFAGWVAGGANFGRLAKRLFGKSDEVTEGIVTVEKASSKWMKSADDVNAEFIADQLAKGKKQGDIKSPWKSGSDVLEYTTEEAEQFVRIHGDDNAVGGWMMKKEDLMNTDGTMMSPSQMKDRFALPELPTKISDVTVPAGTKMRTGEAGAVDGWGSGGGTQYQAADRIDGSAISNTTELH